jgi:type IV pilus assembly protein PilN
MMVRINLLPHREQKRQRASASSSRWRSASDRACARHRAGARRHRAASRTRTAATRCCKTEIAKLDEQIKEIDKLREQTQALLARKQVVETLQSNEPRPSTRSDQLVRQLPDGIYLRREADGAKVTLVGYAQSNARVSTLMRNIDARPGCRQPELVEIKPVQIAARQGPARSTSSPLRTLAEADCAA